MFNNELSKFCHSYATLLPHAGNNRQRFKCSHCFLPCCRKDFEANNCRIWSLENHKVLFLDSIIFDKSQALCYRGCHTFPSATIQKGTVISTNWANSLATSCVFIIFWMFDLTVFFQKNKPVLGNLHSTVRFPKLLLCELNEPTVNNVHFLHVGIQKGIIFHWF